MACSISPRSTLMESAHKFYWVAGYGGVYNLLAPAKKFSPDYGEWRASTVFGNGNA